MITQITFHQLKKRYIMDIQIHTYVEQNDPNQNLGAITRAPKKHVYCNGAHKITKKYCKPFKIIIDNIS